MMNFYQGEQKKYYEKQGMNESEIQKKLTISREKAIELLFNKTGEKHYSEIIVDQMIKDNTLGSYDFFIVNIDQYIQKINKMKSDNKTRNNKSTNNKSRNNKSRNNNNVPKRTGLSSDKLLQRLKNEEKYSSDLEKYIKKLKYKIQVLEKNINN